MLRATYSPTAASCSNTWKKSPKRARSSACIASIDDELSIMKRMSALFLAYCGTRIGVDWLEQLGGFSTGGAKHPQKTSAKKQRMIRRWASGRPNELRSPPHASPTAVAVAPHGLGS